MSTRTRPPELDEERYRRRTSPPSKRRRPPAGPVRTFGPLALGGAILAGLLIGFLIGGRGGDTKTVTAVKTVTAPATTAAGGAAPSGAASRATIALAVLNGSGVDGLAGQTADQAKSLGYTQVTEGNAPPRSGPSVVYYRGSAQAEARQVADDLGIVSDPKRLPASGELAGAAPPDARVVAVLGSDAESANSVLEGGADATSTDAGAADATSTDATGADATSTDATGADATSTDAGAADATSTAP